MKVTITCQSDGEEWPEWLLGRPPEIGKCPQIPVAARTGLERALKPVSEHPRDTLEPVNNERSRSASGIPPPAVPRESFSAKKPLNLAETLKMKPVSGIRHKRGLPSTCCNCGEEIETETYGRCPNNRRKCTGCCNCC